MNKIECVRKLTFCSGHRVLGHENKCANAHGHNYVVYIHAQASQLDNLGRVIDFSIIKNTIGEWLELNWDHTFLIFKEDTDLINCRSVLEKNKPVFICDFNPTAENLALYLLEEICPKLLDEFGVNVVKIELHETENCKVVVEAE